MFVVGYLQHTKPLGSLSLREYWMFYWGPGFLQSYDSAPCPPPVVSLSQSVSPCWAYWRKRGARGGWGAKSYDREKAWSSVNHSILSGITKHLVLDFVYRAKCVAAGSPSAPPLPQQFLELQCSDDNCNIWAVLYILGQEFWQVVDRIRETRCPHQTAQRMGQGKNKKPDFLIINFKEELKQSGPRYKNGLNFIK